MIPFLPRKVGEPDLSARPENIMLDDKIGDRGPCGFRQGVVGGTHVGELGLTVPEWRRRGQGDRVQHAQYDRNRHIGRVGVPQPIPERIEPAPVMQVPHLVILVEIRDIADLRDRQAAAAGTGGRAANLQRSEARREIPKFRVVE